MNPLWVSVFGLIGTVLGSGITVISQILLKKNERLNVFRLVAAEKRLEAHQKAFMLWNELFSNIHNDDGLSSIIFRCQDWWNKNCLYLDPKSREAFKMAYLTASIFNSIPKSDNKLKKDNFKIIEKTGELLVRGVDLPTIGEFEGKKIQKVKK